MGSKKRKGFTLIEILMSVSIMSIMAGVMTLSYHAADQTPKREAEKVAAYITRLAQKSDRIKTGFEMEISGDALCVSWGDNGQYKEPYFEISAGLTYTPISWDTNSRLKYDCTNYPRGAKISVLDSQPTGNKHNYIQITSETNSSPYYVLITSQDRI